MHRASQQACSRHVAHQSRCQAIKVKALPSGNAAVPVPPHNYNYKADVLKDTRTVIQERYPELQDLIDQGNLVVHRRPESYQERRTDGYKEPELVFLLGTAHVSAQSAAEVHRLVAAVQPDCVIVELCKSRVGVLAMHEQEQHAQLLGAQQHQSGSKQHAAAEQASTPGDRHLGQHQGSPTPTPQRLPLPTAAEPSVNHQQSIMSGSNSSANAGSLAVTPPPAAAAAAATASGARSGKAINLLSLSGNNLLSAVSRSVQLGGQSGLLLRLLIAGQVKRAADQLGVQPGAEFRAAAAAADSSGATLVLGDRPIEITLQRAWEALSWQRRMRLLGDLLVAATLPQEQELNQATIEQLRSDDAISEFFNALSSRYPELIAPLIAERDLYLAWSLKRSKAVNGAKAVVGIMGKGHLRGVVYALKHGDSCSLRFTDLVGGKNKKPTKQDLTLGLLRRVLLEGLVGAGLYAAWLAATSSYLQ